MQAAPSRATHVSACEICCYSSDSTLELATARLWIRKTLQCFTRHQSNHCYCIYSTNMHMRLTHLVVPPCTTGLDCREPMWEDTRTRKQRPRRKRDPPSWLSGSITMIQQTRLPVHISYYGYASGHDVSACQPTHNLALTTNFCTSFTYE